MAKKKVSGDISLVEEAGTALAISANCDVKFDAKLSTDDLVSAVGFDLEALFAKQKKMLEKESKEKAKNLSSLRKEEEKLVDELISNYKYKDIDKLLAQLNSFSGFKHKIDVCEGDFSDKGDKIDLYIQILRDVHNNGRQFEEIGLDKDVTIACPKNIQDHRKLVEEAQNVYYDVQNKLGKLVRQIAEMPMIHKSIRACMVKEMLNGGFKDSQDLLRKVSKSLNLDEFVK